MNILKFDDLNFEVDCSDHFIVVEFNNKGMEIDSTLLSWTDIHRAHEVLLGKERQMKDTCSHPRTEPVFIQLPQSDLHTRCKKCGMYKNAAQDWEEYKSNET